MSFIRENMGKHKTFLTRAGFYITSLLFASFAVAPSALAAVSITEFPVPTTFSGPFQITLGPDGNLWFTEDIAGNIGKITPSGAITEYPIPTVDSHPLGITAGPDGNVWFTEGSSNKIGKITPSGAVT
jgi:streptogramin lyase